MAEKPRRDDVLSERTIQPRQAKRRSLESGATIKSTKGTAFKGVMVDVSENGCKIVGTFDYAKAGDVVDISIEGLERWPGVVRWVRHDAMGIEFLSPLYTPVVDHLVRTRPVVELEKAA